MSALTQLERDAWRRLVREARAGLERLDDTSARALGKLASRMMRVVIPPPHDVEHMRLFRDFLQALIDLLSQSPVQRAASAPELRLTCDRIEAALYADAPQRRHRADIDD